MSPTLTSAHEPTALTNTSSSKPVVLMLSALTYAAFEPDAVMVTSPPMATSPNPKVSKLAVAVAFDHNQS